MRIAYTLGLMLVVGAALATRLPELGGYANHDEGVYAQTLLLMQHGLPLYREIYHNQGPLFLPLIYPLWELLGASLTAARTAIVIESIVGILGAWWAGALLGGPVGGLISGLVWAFSPLALVQSRSLQSEGPAVAWSLLAVAAALAYARTHRQRHLVLAGGALGLSLAMKPLTLATLLPVLLAAGLVGRPSMRARLASMATVLALSFLVPLVTAAAFGLLEVIEPLLIYRSAPDWLMTTLYGEETLRTSMRASNPSDFLGGWDVLQNGLRPEGDGIILLALGGCLAAALWRPREALVLLVWLVATGALLANHAPLLERHAVAVVAPLAVLSAGCAVPLMRLRRNRNIPMVLASVVACACIGVYLLGFPALARTTQAALAPPKPGGPLLDASRVLAASTETHDYIFTDHNYLAVLAHRTMLPELADLDDYRIRSHWITEHDAISALERRRPQGSALWSGAESYYARYFPGALTWITTHHQMIWEGENGQFLGVARGTQLDASKLPGHRAIGTGFADGSILRAAAFPGQAVPGRDLEVHLLWQLGRPPDGDDSSRVTLVRRVSPEGWSTFVDATKTFGGRWIPLEAIQAGDLTAQNLKLKLPQALATGEYRVVVGRAHATSDIPARAPPSRESPDGLANVGVLNVINAP
ncbi:MAG: glycosyltransferase family 39 protein [Chloroflexota bacterium]